MHVGPGPVWVVEVVELDDVVVVDVVGGLSVVVVGVVVAVVVAVVGGAVLVQAAARATRPRIIAKVAADFERRMSLLAIGTAPPGATRVGLFDARPHPSMTAVHRRIVSIDGHLSQPCSLVGVVVPEPGKRRNEGSRPQDAEHPARDDRSAQPRQGLDNAGFDVAEGRT